MQLWPKWPFAKSALRRKRDCKQGRIERGRQKKTKRSPNYTKLWQWLKTWVVLPKFINSLEEPQGGLLNSSNISKVWVEHFNFLFPKNSVDNDSIPPLILRNLYTTQMSWLDKIFWHGISIRNQLIRITAPVEFRNMETGEEQFLLAYQEQGSLDKKQRKKTLTFSDLLMLINSN